MKDIIVFEQPVNEHIRACLRLEHLFQQAIYHLRGASAWDSRSSLTAIIDIINLFDRPDLKSKLTKELGRYLANLSRLEHIPQVDNQKLAAVLLELEDLIDVLHATNGKLCQELRDNPFINTIRQYQLNPGGTCGFDTPAYLLWLQQPAANRIADLAHWLRMLETGLAVVNMLLKLTRASSAATAKIAHKGFYQATLDPQAPCQLIRVAVAGELKVYPEISVGRHGICIRFYPLNINQPATQLPQDVPFSLTTCIF